MSERWPGGIVRSTPVTPTGPLQNGTAPGIWTMEQAAYWTKQGLWPTAGNFLAVEDVFSTWLYTGTGSTQTITNGINLSGQGGLVWFKSRTSGIFAHQLYDTVRGATIQIGTNSTSGNSTNATGLTAFTSSGFTIGSLSGVNSGNMASWTFREAPKFFDVVTWTGNGSSGRTISHNLGVAPGCVMIKRTDSTGDWTTWHRSLSGSYPSSRDYLFLNSTAATTTAVQPFTVAPSATELTLSASVSANSNGATYVAYLYAHDTSSTGIIQCGSYYVPNEASPTQVTLGWEPQFLLVKKSNTASNWWMIDNMRGFTASGADNAIYPNLTDAETAETGWSPTSTGFTASGATANGGFDTYIYVAIRRGPMRTPTSGTSVFAPVSSSAATGTTLNTGFPIDLQIMRATGITNDTRVIDRLRGTRTLPSDGNAQELLTNTTGAEYTNSGTVRGWDNTGFQMPSGFSGITDIFWNFRRAPSFFDEVCYTGTGSTATYNHNLGVVPELIIAKRRNSTGTWRTVCNFTPSSYDVLDINSTAAKGNGSYFSGATLASQPTATTFVTGDNTNINASGGTYVAYLFASCPGVSKVGSYTGTGTTQTINCGFTTGARFVLIKRTDSTGDWYVWDSARGIVAGNDPYLLLNSTAAEVTSTDYIDTDNSGFQISSTAPAAINANGGTFIYLAIS